MSFEYAQVITTAQHTMNRIVEDLYQIPQTYSNPVTLRIVSTAGELTVSLSMQRNTSAQSLSLETAAALSLLATLCALTNVEESGKEDGSLRQALT